jgi:hypothetical protein
VRFVCARACMRGHRRRTHVHRDRVAAMMLVVPGANVPGANAAARVQLSTRCRRHGRKLDVLRRFIPSRNTHCRVPQHTTAAGHARGAGCHGPIACGFLRRRRGCRRRDDGGTAAAPAHIARSAAAPLLGHRVRAGGTRTNGNHQCLGENARSCPAPLTSAVWLL